MTEMKKPLAVITYGWPDVALEWLKLNEKYVMCLRISRQ